ncbi:hypothetical protein JKP88DRAFT_280485 [Tribonema minus]|uniref:Ankyrin repeat domain-containing protein n=1 Tax=Tribonema minus TaxID=303371 RepID=A0A835YXV6_9STRA|nr:hypothetical protein JKP88DRAFT_280485 [Tribonema minus]
MSGVTLDKTSNQEQHPPADKRAGSKRGSRGSGSSKAKRARAAAEAPAAPRGTPLSSAAKNAGWLARGDAVNLLAAHLVPRTLSLPASCGGRGKKLDAPPPKHAPGPASRILEFIGPGHYATIACCVELEDLYREMFGVETDLRLTLGTVSPQQPDTNKAEAWERQRHVARWAPLQKRRDVNKLIVCAAQNGNWDMALDAHARGRVFNTHFTWTATMLNAAIAHGQVAFLHEALRRWFHLGTNDLCDTAAKHGQLGALELLRSRQPPAPWGTSTVKLACDNGHLAIAAWLINHNCPVDDTVAVSAAAQGSVPLLTRLRELRCPMWPDTCAAAARHGHLAALQYLRTEHVAMDELTSAAAARGGHCAVDESACEEAGRGGQVSALQYLKRRGVLWGETVRLAAHYGQLPLLRTAHELEAPFEGSACKAAAQEQRLEVLRWLRAIGCPWDGSECETAAREGRMKVLQCLHELEAPFDASVCKAAAQAGRLEVLQWLRAIGCPFDESACEAAVREGHLEVLQWLRAVRCPFDKSACEAAAQEGHLEVLQWLRAVRCPWDADACERVATTDDMLEWVQEQRLLEAV